MKMLAVIPARYGSSRFPGKPLALIRNEPLILRVARQVSLTLPRQQILIATDDTRIAETVTTGGFEVVMTPGNLPTGTDRVYQATRNRELEMILNIQGDEPLIDPDDILSLIRLKQEFPDHVINGMTELAPDEDPESPHIPKVVVNDRNELLYASRKAIPGSLEPHTRYRKQVCLYAYTPGQLALFGAAGHKTPLEALEDIEILRFLELGIRVKMLPTRKGSLAVDRPEDIGRIERLID